MKNSVIWIRRVMRLKDNKIIHEALRSSENLHFIFVFDKYILQHFKNPNDRRLSFIANTLELIDKELKSLGGKLHLVYGDSREVIPNFVKETNSTQLFTEMDFEPSSKIRDESVIKSLEGIAEVKFVLDHLLIHPARILKDDETPFRVFTPFMKKFRSMISADNLKELNYDLNEKVKKIDNYSFDKIENLREAGYNYIEDDLWKPELANNKFDDFLNVKFDDYHNTRNNLSPDGTSNISPYLRFGQLSLRRAYRLSLPKEKAPNYVNELIWREFYGYIMYHFPDSIELEFQQKYRETIKWNFNEEQWSAFQEGKTGFPVVDASIRQLLRTGWMHNRARMIVASFLTKNMFFDWRLGEKFFAEYLMDYDIASNVGGWQWTASTGTDAQPYFRVFNPISQAEKFDPNGDYIRKYVPELKNVKNGDIYDGVIIARDYNIDYPEPIVDYKSSREKAIEYFKSVV